MIFRLLLVTVFIVILIKFSKKKKGRKRVGRKKRIVVSELSGLRSRFDRIMNYFNPVSERERLAHALHTLMNVRVVERRTEAYRSGVDAIQNIIHAREADVKRIESIDKLKVQYEAARDTFTDGLRKEIDACFNLTDEILALEPFGMRIEELRSAVRMLPWLIAKGEDGRDNSVHWVTELAEIKTSVQQELDRESSWWNDI